MRTITSLTVFSIGALIVPLVAFASPVIRTGDTVSLKEDQAVSGDFYALGGSVTNSAKISGDTYIAAGTITQNGEVGADLTAAVGQIEIHAPITDDVRIAGGRVVVANKVGGDVLVVGGELVIASTAEIEGDVLFYGGSLLIEGTVKGSVLAKSETVRIDARIGKDVDVTANVELVFGAHADVGGNVKYKSGKEMVRAIDSVIVGSVTRDESFTLADEPTGPTPMPILIMLFTGLVVRFVFGTRITTFMNQVGVSFGHAALIGFAGLVLIPVAALLALASVLGIVIGATIIFAYITLLIVSWSLSGLFLGGLLSRYATGTASYGPLWIILGTLTIYATTFIPGFGNILALVVMLMVLGGFLRLLYARYR
jgi:cytoskeletal protein CcmA (bactofilin family)